MITTTRSTFRWLGGWLSVDWARWRHIALPRQEISAEFRPLIGDYPDCLEQERRACLDRHCPGWGMRRA